MREIKGRKSEKRVRREKKTKQRVSECVFGWRRLSRVGLERKKSYRHGGERVVALLFSSKV